MHGLKTFTKLVIKSLYFFIKMHLLEDKKAVLSQWSRQILADFGIQVALYGPAEHGPQGALWVANHLSWLDPIVLFALRPAGSMAKKEVVGYPFIGAWARLGGIRFVERGCPLSHAAALGTLVADLRKQQNFILFPEGTTTLGDGISEIHEGGLRAAYRLGVPVLPLCFHRPDRHYCWIGDEELVAHIRGLWRFRGANIQLERGPLLQPMDFVTEEAWVAAIVQYINPCHALAERCA